MMKSGEHKPFIPFKPMFKRVGPGNRVGDGLEPWPVETIQSNTGPISDVNPEPFPWAQAIASVIIIAILCYFFPWYYVIPIILLLALALLALALFAIASILNGF
jgi:hypothetical protein